MSATGMTTVEWTKHVEVTYRCEIPAEELKAMIDSGLYADELAEYEAEETETGYACTDRSIDDMREQAA